MPKSSRFSPEVRDRAVRMVLEQQDKHESRWAAITSIAEKIGCSAETLRNWLRQAERDQGRRPGLTTDERQRLKQLEREVFCSPTARTDFPTRFSLIRPRAVIGRSPTPGDERKQSAQGHSRRSSIGGVWLATFVSTSRRSARSSPPPTVLMEQ